MPLESSAARQLLHLVADASAQADARKTIWPDHPLPNAVLIATATYRQHASLAGWKSNLAEQQRPAFWRVVQASPKVDNIFAAGIDIFLQCNPRLLPASHLGAAGRIQSSANIGIESARLPVEDEGPRRDRRDVVERLPPGLSPRCYSLTNPLRRRKSTDSNIHSGLILTRPGSRASTVRQDGIHHRAPSRRQQGTTDTDRMWHLRRRSASNGRFASRRSIEGAAEHRLG